MWFAADGMQLQSLRDCHILLLHHMYIVYSIVAPIKDCSWLDEKSFCFVRLVIPLEVWPHWQYCITCITKVVGVWLGCINIMYSIPVFSVSYGYAYDRKDSILCLNWWDVVIPISHLWVTILAYTLVYAIYCLDSTLYSKLRIECSDY